MSIGFSFIVGKNTFCIIYLLIYHYFNTKYILKIYKSLVDFVSVFNYILKHVSLFLRSLIERNYDDMYKK